MLFGKFFKNLHTVMVILVLFEQFSAKFCLNFMLLILRALPNTWAMMHFLCTFSIMRHCVLKALGLLLSNRFEITKKVVFTGNKNHF